MEDTLNRALEAERKQCNILGIKMENGVKDLNHSQFANNTLLMGGASITTTQIFENILTIFCNASGGNINKKKKNIYS